MLIGLLSLYLLFSRDSFAEELSAQRLTLQDAVEWALRSHPTLQAAHGGILAQEARLGEMKSGFYPHLGFASDYTRTTLGFTTIPPSGSVNRFGAILSLQQRLYDFGRTGADVEAAREGVQANHWVEEAAIVNVIVNVKVSYFGLLVARQLVQVHEETVRQFEEHFAQAKGLFDVGIRPKFDVMKAGVDLGHAKLNLIKAKNAVNVARARLSNVIGLPDRPIGEVEALLGFEKIEITEEEALNEALGYHPELLSLKARARAAGAFVRSAKLNGLPVISGTADYVYSGETFPLARNWNIGANLTVPLFSGYLQESQISGAKADEMLARANVEALRQNILLEVREVYSNLLEAEERIFTSEGVVHQAEENLSLANGRFQAGVGGSVERTDAQILLTQAKTSRSQAQYDYRVAEAILEKVMGRR